MAAEWDGVTRDLAAGTDPMVPWQQWRAEVVDRTASPIRRLLRLRQNLSPSKRSQLLSELTAAGWGEVWPALGIADFLCVQYIGPGDPGPWLLGQIDNLEGELVDGDVWHHLGGGL